MEPAAAVLKEAVLLEKLRRCEAVALDAFLHLALRLRIVGEKRHFVLVQQHFHKHEQIEIGRILGVDAGDVGDERVEIVELDRVHLADRPVVPRGERAAEHHAEAAVNGRLRESVALIVHVERARDAALEIFENRELCESVNIIRRELGLQREHLVEKPALQRQIVGVGAQERHRAVRVGVLEAGHQEVALEVDLALKRRVRADGRADIEDH